jgi:oligoribonuclease NrnB/cAMP/cGMP phosphodiesterase (DHH superfamily)
MDLTNYFLYSHAGCMDGSGAYILARHAGLQTKNIRWLNPGHVDEDLADSSAFRDPSVPILLVDLSPGSFEMAGRLAHRGNFHVIDHHASAERFALRRGFVISVGNKACGTELFRQWLYLHGFQPQTGNMVPSFEHPSFKRFASLIDDHDRWQHIWPFSQDMARYASFVGQQVFIDHFMDVESRFFQEKEHYWTESELELLTAVKVQEARRLKDLLKKFVVRKRQFQGRDILVGYLVSDEVNSSELLNLYLKQNTDVDLACQVNFRSGKLSYRGLGEVDIPALVGPLGGGGHFNAGGCNLPEGLTDLIIERVVGQ